MFGGGRPCTSTKLLASAAAYTTYWGLQLMSDPPHCTLELLREGGTTGWPHTQPVRRVLTHDQYDVRPSDNAQHPDQTANGSPPLISLLTGCVTNSPAP